MAKIVIDPGHGGTAEVGGSSWNNATGPTGLLEKAVTLALGQRVKAKATHHQVILTRSTDKNVGLADRARVGRDNDAAAFVSIHLNGWPKPTVQGTETFVHTSGPPRALRLARAVQAAVLEATGLANRGVKKAGFGVLKPAHHDAGAAACLVEISFMTDPAEEARLKTPAYLDRLADALVEGIDSFLASAHLETVPGDDDLETLQLFPGQEDAAEINMRAEPEEGT